MRRVFWTHSDCIRAPGGCSEEEAIGELFGIKATAPEHRGAAWRRSAVGRLVSSGRTRAAAQRRRAAGHMDSEPLRATDPEHPGGYLEEEEDGEGHFDSE